MHLAGRWPDSRVPRASAHGRTRAPHRRPTAPHRRPTAPYWRPRASASRRTRAPSRRTRTRTRGRPCAGSPSPTLLVKSVANPVQLRAQVRRLTVQLPASRRTPGNSSAASQKTFKAHRNSSSASQHHRNEAKRRPDTNESHDPDRRRPQTGPGPTQRLSTRQSSTNIATPGRRSARSSASRPCQRPYFP